MNKKIKVLIVDDQPLIRKILRRGLEEDPEIEIAGEAEDAYKARDLIVKLAPDVMTLDVEMPRMNGLEFLQKLMPQYPMRVIMVSSLTKKGELITLKSLETGALDFVAKPDGGAFALDNTINELRHKIKMAAMVPVTKLKITNKIKNTNTIKQLQKSDTNKKFQVKLITVGASTGGTKALKELISGLAMKIPGMVIVQHMPAGFTKMFADRLNADFPHFEIKEAENGDIIQSNKIFIAPGDFQLEIKKRANEFQIHIFKGDKVNGHRPSVDVLFQSVGNLQLGNKAIAVILTGMGKDGAYGLKAIKDLGAQTIGQDEQSSIVYGMPRVAYEIGAIEHRLPLNKIAEKINYLI